MKISSRFSGTTSRNRGPAAESLAVSSSALGFSFDITPVADQCLAMKNVWEQYIYEMQTGTSDPDVVVPELLAELEAVGLREVLAEAQAQLDAYMGK